MKNLSKFIVSFLVGVGIGAIIEMIMTLIFKEFIVGTPDFVTIHSPEFVKVSQTLIYGGFGIVSVLASKIYEKNLSLFVQATTHMASMLLYYLFAGYFLKWFNNFTGLVMSIISFFIIYLIIWSVFYFINKREIEEINKKLSWLKDFLLWEIFFYIDKCYILLYSVIYKGAPNEDNFN